MLSFIFVLFSKEANLGQSFAMYLPETSGLQGPLLYFKLVVYLEFIVGLSILLTNPERAK